MPQQLPGESVEMKFNVKTLLWRLFIAAAIAFDYFLFSTGNPSLTYTAIGGWFEVGVFALIAVTATYALKAVKEKGERIGFLAYVILLTAWSLILLFLSAGARDFAEREIDARAAQFVKNPKDSLVAASPETRELMALLESRHFSFRREAFIPTFRRADYLLSVDSSENFRLILTISWDGTAQAFLRRTVLQ